VLQDIRFALRTFLRQPGYAAAAILTLALAVGACTAVFSVVDAVLLRPLPFPEADSLAVVWTTNSESEEVRGLVSPADYEDWSAEARSFDRLGAYTEAFFNVAGDGDPERVDGVIASERLFETLGVAPIQGRTFLAEEARENVAIVGEGLWRRRYGSAPDLVGRAISVDDVPRVVVGIVPSDAVFSGKQVDVYVPFAPTPEARTNRSARFLTVVGRLAAGASIERAQREMDVLTRAIAERHPTSSAGRGARIVALGDELVGSARPSLLALLAAVGLVLALACANVAGLLLARAEARRAEISVRFALGAGRLRVARLLLVEGVSLALVGGALGTALAWLGVDLIVALTPVDIPRRDAIGVDARVLGTALSASLAAGVLSSLLSVLHASRLAARGGLKGTGPGAPRPRARALSTLVVFEVALSAVMLVSAGLFAKSFLRLQSVDPGFSPDGVVAADITLPARYREPVQRAAFQSGALERFRAIPGVRFAGTTSHLPLSGEDGKRTFAVEGGLGTETDEKPTTEFRRSSPGYFEAMGISLVRGRSFTEQDDAEAPGVVIVNTAFARRFLPGEDPLGRVLFVDDGPRRRREVVGVVADVKHFGLGVDARPEVYVPYLDRTWPSMTFVVRGTGDPADLVAAMRREVSALDGTLPLTNVETMGRYVSASIASQRFAVFVLGLFACAALLLASIGMYGVISRSVESRTQEIGVRMALGARPRGIFGLVVGRGLFLTLTGLAIGLIAALAATRLVSGLLFGVGNADPSTYAGVATLLAVVALVACYVPARRAATVDPMVALKHE
jgi:putative ABC transport system permease protein